MLSKYDFPPPSVTMDEAINSRHCVVCFVQSPESCQCLGPLGGIVGGGSTWQSWWLLALGCTETDNRMGVTVH